MKKNILLSQFFCIYFDFDYSFKEILLFDYFFELMKVKYNIFKF